MVTPLGPSGQTPASAFAQQLLRSQPGGLQNLANPIIGALLQKREAAERKRIEGEDQDSFRRAIQALMGGVKEFRNPDTGEVLVPGQQPGQQAFAQVLAGNPRTAPIAANVMSQALQQNRLRFVNVPNVGLVRTEGDDANVVIPAGQQPTTLERNLRSAGIDPQSPEGQEIIRANLMKPVASLNVSRSEETEEAKAIGKFRAKQFVGIQEGADSARKQNARLDQLGGLLERVNTGTGAETALAVKRAAKRVGIDLEALGVADDVAPAEAALALSSELALELRNPAGGAGMPGAMSDKDREFLQSMVPGLGQTGQGRKILIEARKRTNQRSIDVAKLSREYRRQRGQLDEGFGDLLDERFANSSLFQDLEQDLGQAVSAPTTPSDGFDFGASAVNAAQSAGGFLNQIQSATSVEQLPADVSRMSPAERKAMDAKLKELGF